MACDRLPALQQFGCSSVIKVNPDKAQERVRSHSLHVRESFLSRVFDVFPVF